MITAPTTKSTIPHIDGRTIEQIEMENIRLKDQLIYNLECIKIKRKELRTEKVKKEQQDLFNKSRKIFAFRIAIDKPLTPEEQQTIFTQLKTFIEKDKTKISKIFMLNNYIYLKTNINIKIILDKIPTNCGYILEQINPKEILKI